MSIHQLPINEKQAVAVMRRMEAVHEDSRFEMVDVRGTDDLRYVREIRPTKNPRTGAKFDQIIMYGRAAGSSNRVRRSA